MKKVYEHHNLPEMGDRIRVPKGNVRGFSGRGTVTSVPYGGYPATRYGIKIGMREEYLLPGDFTTLDGESISWRIR